MDSANLGELPLKGAGVEPAHHLSLQVFKEQHLRLVNDPLPPTTG